jgi:hypothetical protein
MARIKRAPPYVRSTPPRAAKKRSTVSSSGHKKPHSEEDEEDDGVDDSEEEYSKRSGEESGGSEEEEAMEAEDADDSESEAEESKSNAKSNAKEVVQQEARARATDDTSSDESNPNEIDRYADLDEEDKKDIRSLKFTEEEILKYEGMLKMSRKDYSRFMKVLSIPKLIKHLTAQQTLGAIQYISNQLDPTNNRVPDVEEIRSFLYLQELVLLFAQKERKGKAHHIASESEEDEDSEESTVKESKKKAKSKKNIQARCKYSCS